MSFAASVSGLEQEAARQLLLDVEVPVLVVQIAPVPIDRLRAEAEGLKLAKEGLDREPDVGHDR